MTILFICAVFFSSNNLVNFNYTEFLSYFLYTHVVPNSQSLTPNHRLYSNSCIEMIYCGWPVEITLEKFKIYIIQSYNSNQILTITQFPLISQNTSFDLTPFIVVASLSNVVVK